MRLIRLYLFTLLTISLFTLQVNGYSTVGGIEDGDKVNLDYVLSYDGEVQQNGPGFETYVTNTAVIQGFYEGLLGLKIGDQKNIVVPVGKGYPPTHELGNKILYFDVTINSIVENVRGDNYIAPPPEQELFQFTAREDSASVFGDLFTSPLFLAISLTAIIGFVYVKSTESSPSVPKASKSTKLSAKEKLQKRLNEVENSDFD